MVETVTVASGRGGVLKAEGRKTDGPAREVRTKEEVSRRSGGWFRESRNINLDNGVKTAGRESSRDSGNMICIGRKACRQGTQCGGGTLGCKNEMEEKDEEKRMEVEHQKLVSRMIASADGGTGFLHRITEPTV